jgi:hypothetical protein
LLDLGRNDKLKGRHMKKTAVAAMFALAGAGLIPPTAAGAAVFAPAQGAMRDQSASVVIQAQQTKRQQRTVIRPAARPALRAAPNRGVRAGNLRPGRQVGPGRRLNPGRAAIVHRRGFRPPGYVRWHPRHLAYHRWRHRPYYGRIIGGIAIGTILAASAYYAYAAEPPAPGLCWFWADPDETQGYWDYCVDPS